MARNHVVDPSVFNDVINEFGFWYDWYVVSGKKPDKYGKLTPSFEKKQIFGSLQTNGIIIHKSKTGNIVTEEGDFYCKSLFRLNIGDFVFYDNKYWLCESVHPYDEWGVREAHLVVTDLSQNRDFFEYLKFLEGDEIV